MKAPEQYTSAETNQLMTAAAAGSDYKAIIKIFLYGGADSHNFLVPTPTNPNHKTYHKVRGALAIADSEVPGHVLNMDGDPESGMWRLNPFMDRTFGLWSQGKVALVKSVGTLDEYLTKDQFLRNRKRAPDQIFAHNIQQDLWQASEIPDVPRTNGIFGRAAELIDPHFNAGRMSAYSTFGSVRENYGFNRVAADVGSAGPVLFDTAPFEAGIAKLTQQMRLREMAGHINRTDPRNVIYNLVQNTSVSYYQSQTELSTLIAAAPTNVEAIFTALPLIGDSGSHRSNTIKEQARMALRVINARQALGQRRQTIFIGMGGWDHHSSLRLQHDRLTEHLDNTIGAIWDALGLLGLQDSVVIQIESEFARTLVANGTAGVDHGWAGNGIVIGGPVRGGLYGPMPDYTISGPRDLGQGRFIPDVSTEQYHAPVMAWYGVPKPLMHLALRNSPAFPLLYKYDFMGVA